MLNTKDINRVKLLKYFQYRFPLSNYTENNYSLYNENISQMVIVTSPEGAKYYISSDFYDKCLDYNKVLERDKLINDILKD